MVSTRLVRIVRQDCTYLVEWYTDVLSFHQAEYASQFGNRPDSGTDPADVALAHVTFIFDGDPAYQSLIEGIDMVLAEGMNKVLLLPGGP